jgi:hypothetical protein
MILRCERDGRTYESDRTIRVPVKDPVIDYVFVTPEFDHVFAVEWRWLEANVHELPGEELKRLIETNPAIELRTALENIDSAQTSERQQDASARGDEVRVAT